MTISNLFCIKTNENILHLTVLGIVIDRYIYIPIHCVIIYLQFSQILRNMNEFISVVFIRSYIIRGKAIHQFPLKFALLFRIFDKGSYGSLCNFSLD